MRRYIGATASTAVAGVKRSRETAFIETDVLPLSEQFACSYTAFPGIVEAAPINRGQGAVKFGYRKDDKNATEG